MTKEKTDTLGATIKRLRQRQFNTGRDAYLTRNYGITLEKYLQLLENQNQCCAICGNADAGSSGKYNTFSVDHNHMTGKIRGLLCQSCNLQVVPAIEYYESRLDAAKIYLRASESLKVLQE